jgi:hypothetical protein
VVEPLIFVLAGVAIVLLTVLAIGRSRRRSSSPRQEQPFFDRGDDPDETSPAGSGTPATSKGGRRRPVTAPAGALVGAATAPSSADISTSNAPLAARSAPPSSRPATAERTGTVRFWRLFDSDADIGEGAGPVCFAVDGVTVDGVIDLVTMDFEHRGFVVRAQSADRLQAHRGSLVLQATFRSVHTDLSRRNGVYEGTEQPFVLVEIEVPAKDPPAPISPIVGFS